MLILVDAQRFVFTIDDKITFGPFEKQIPPIEFCKCQFRYVSFETRFYFWRRS